MQAIEELEFTADASSAAAAAAAAAAPVEMEIDWGDLVVVDDAAHAATDAADCCGGGTGGDPLDIDWNVVSSEEGAAGGGGEISWDIDFGVGEEGSADCAVAGGDDVCVFHP